MGFWSNGRKLPYLCVPHIPSHLGDISLGGRKPSNSLWICLEGKMSTQLAKQGLCLHKCDCFLFSSGFNVEECFFLSSLGAELRNHQSA